MYSYVYECLFYYLAMCALQFASQKRLVTSADYRAMILANFPVIKDVAVWGGEDNVPIDCTHNHVCIVNEK